MTVSTMDLTHTRQLDWFDPSKHPHAHVNIVGVGGIGSFTAFALAKLGLPRMTLIDFDSVEAHNVPNQMYEPADVGDAKGLALAGHIVAADYPTEVEVIDRPLQDIDRRDYRGIVVGALDSMEARAELWKKCKMNLSVPLLIDGRLGGQNVVLYGVNPCDPEDIKGYEATLHSDDEGLDYGCTGRGIIDVGLLVGSLITRQVRRHFTGETTEKMVYMDQAHLNLYTSDTWIQ